MSEISIVLVTAGNEEEAAKIGRTLVEERLGACANIVPRIRSIYRWKGEILRRTGVPYNHQDKDFPVPRPRKKGQRTAQLRSPRDNIISCRPRTAAIPRVGAWGDEKDEHRSNLHPRSYCFPTLILTDSACAVRPSSPARRMIDRASRSSRW